MDGAPGRSVEIEWKPFQIDPSLESEGLTFADYSKRRWGTSDPTFMNGIRSAGRKDGANFANIGWVSNTNRAHQLVHYCDTNKIASTDRLNALLFESQYELGENIALVDVLVRIGQEAATESGATIDLEDLRRFLDRNEGKYTVDQEINYGRGKYGVRSVPHFIVSGGSDARPYMFSGAQSPDTFVDIFEELSE